MFIFIGSCLVYNGYLYTSYPFNNTLQQRVEVFNEFLLLTQCYYFVLYAGLVQEPEVREIIAYVHVAHLGVLFVVNFVVIIYVNIKEGCRKLHLRKLAEEHKLNIEIRAHLAKGSSSHGQPSVPANPNELIPLDDSVAIKLRRSASVAEPARTGNAS